MNLADVLPKKLNSADNLPNKWLNQQYSSHKKYSESSSKQKFHSCFGLREIVIQSRSARAAATPIMGVMGHYVKDEISNFVGGKEPAGVPLTHFYLKGNKQLVLHFKNSVY